MIKLVNISKTYQSVTGIKTLGLDRINLELGDRGFVTFVGRSGSGKSTLLNVLGGLDRFENGEYLFNNVDTAMFNPEQWDVFRRAHVGFVFQDFSLISELTVFDNIKLSLKENTNDAKVDTIAKRLDLEHLLDKKANELSGGEAQRVSIARALIKNPNIILADEPTGNLDQASAKIILDYLKDLSKSMLVIMVTHDFEAAETYSDCIFKMIDGKIAEKNIINKLPEPTDRIKEKQQVDSVLESSNHTTLSPSILKSLVSFNLLSNLKNSILSIVQFSLSFILAYLLITIVLFSLSDVSIRTFKANDFETYNFSYDDDCDIDCSSKNIELIRDVKSLQQQYPNGEVHYAYNTPIYFSDFSTYVAAPSSIIQRNTINSLTLYDIDDDLNYVAGGPANNENDIVVTDYVAEMLMHYSIVDVERPALVVGKSISIPINDVNVSFVISGVINTDYETYKSENAFVSDYQASVFTYNVERNYSTIFITDDTLSYLSTALYKSPVLYTSQDDDLTINKIGNMEYFDSKYPTTTLYGSYPTQEGDIVIPLSLILSQEYISYNTFSQSPSNYLNLYLDKHYSFDGNYSSDNPLESGYTISGIIDDSEFEAIDYNERIIYIDGESYNTIFNHKWEYHPVYGRITLSSDDDTKVLEEILDNDYRLNSVISVFLYDIYGTITQLNDIILFLALFVIIIIGLQMYLYASNSIKVKQKQMGILRSQGFSQKSINKIIRLQSIIIIAIAFILFILLALFINAQLESYFESLYGFKFILFYLSPVKLSVMAVLAFGMTLFSTYLSVLYLKKSNPISTLRKSM